MSKSNSFFLFGPRGSGKTSLLLDEFLKSDSLFVDLLDIHFFDQLILDSSRFEALIDLPENINKRVIIDEVQKYPKLLDVAHSQIQKRKRQFILTGSSSRRLKQKGTNLLAGRAWVYYLYPFSTFELHSDFDLNKALQWGGLPEAYLAKNEFEVREYLTAYVLTYLQKEIQEEQWVKKLEPFRKFLAIAAQMNGKIINKSKIAREVGVNDVTVAQYFEILEDTLIGFYLPAFAHSVRKAQKQLPKFYLIDTGIKRALEKTLSVPLLSQTSAYGEAFEHWVILEVVKNISYHRLDWSLAYAKTKDDLEIDLIITRPGNKTLMIEIKSKERVTESDAKTLLSFGSDLDKNAEKWILSNDLLERQFGEVRAMHWKGGLRELFAPR